MTTMLENKIWWFFFPSVIEKKTEYLYSHLVCRLLKPWERFVTPLPQSLSKHPFINARRDKEMLYFFMFDFFHRSLCTDIDYEIISLSFLRHSNLWFIQKQQRLSIPCKVRVLQIKYTINQGKPIAMTNKSPQWPALWGGKGRLMGKIGRREVSRDYHIFHLYIILWEWKMLLDIWEVEKR